MLAGTKSYYCICVFFINFLVLSRMYLPGFRSLLKSVYLLPACHEIFRF